jgi:hypothetical protein
MFINGICSYIMFQLWLIISTDDCQDAGSSQEEDDDDEVPRVISHSLRILITGTM